MSEEVDERLADADVILVRHAESAANAGMATSDYASIPLSERGREQAEELVGQLDKLLVPEMKDYDSYYCEECGDYHYPYPECLSDIGLSIIATPYYRTIQTALPLADGANADLTICRDWREFTYLQSERLHGTNRDERKRYRDEFWRRAKGDLRYYDRSANGDDDPNVESPLEFVARIDQAMIDLAGRVDSARDAREGLPIILVTHGYAMSTAIDLAMSLDIDDAAQLMAEKSSATHNILNCGMVGLKFNDEEYRLELV